MPELELCRESAIDASIYHTSVSSLVEFRKPLCGTAPSVIPIPWGNNATTCRWALPTRFFLFLSPCFSFFLPGADMSSSFRVKGCGKRTQVQLPWDWPTATFEIFDHWWISYVSGNHLFRDLQSLQQCWQYLPDFSIMYISSIEYLTALVVDSIHTAIFQQRAAKMHWSTTPQQAISSSTSHSSLSSHYTMPRRSQSRPQRSRSRRPRHYSPPPIPRTRRSHRSRSPPPHRRHGSPPPSSNTMQSTNLPPLPRLRRRHPTPTPNRRPDPRRSRSLSRRRPLRPRSPRPYRSPATFITPRPIEHHSTHRPRQPDQRRPHLTHTSPDISSDTAPRRSWVHSRPTITLKPNPHTSPTSTIHPSPATTRHPQQPIASAGSTNSPYHTTILQSSIHTPHITIQLPTNGLSHRPHADTTLSTQSAATLPHTITTTPTTRDPPLHEHS